MSSDSGTNHLFYFKSEFVARYLMWSKLLQKDRIGERSDDPCTCTLKLTPQDIQLEIQFHKLNAI